VTAAALLPLAYLVYRAVASTDAERDSVRTSHTLGLVADTGLLVLGVVVLAFLVGVPLAWLVVRTDLPGRRILGVAAALPLVIPSYVAGLSLLGALGPRGFLQQALGPFGVERLPDIYGYHGALLALTLSTYPYVFLLVAAALRASDAAAEEAARSLGERPLGVFLRVTLPGLRPTLAASGLLVALYVLSDFGAVSLMQYSTLTRSVYLRYEALLDRGSAAILALVLVAIAGVIVWLERRVRLRGAGYRATPGAGRQTGLVRLGRYRLPALAFAGTVVGIFLVLPLGVLVWWALDAAPGSLDAGPAWGAALDTVLVAAGAAAVAVAAALPVAMLAWRYPSRGTAVLERLAYVPNAVPAIAIALALVFFGARYGGFLYQTIGMLVLAYVLRFLPQALAPAYAALAGVNPRLEDAARGLGRGRARAFVGVVLPAARPGILAGAALVFLLTLKELPATLLLRPIGFETLATEIWTDTQIGDYGSAAPSALLLIAVAAPFVVALSAKRAWDLGAPG
jgi:iron(III) transport system permease protein